MVSGAGGYAVANDAQVYRDGDAAAQFRPDTDAAASRVVAVVLERVAVPNAATSDSEAANVLSQPI
eukprot:gene15871-23208_t